MLFWGQSEDPPTFMICGFKKEHMLSIYKVLRKVQPGFKLKYDLDNYGLRYVDESFSFFRLFS